MDKSRDLRRGGFSRFSPVKRHINDQSGLDGVGGGGDMFSEKSKKRRVKRLSVVGRVSSIEEDSEMGCAVSEGEDGHRLTTGGISRGTKLARKYSDDCSTVDHASVPRKLRSAVKKRNCKSISPPLPDSKKSNQSVNGVELPRKMPQGDSEGCQKQAFVGPITKDEQEVVETLYALAVMFPNNDKVNKTTLNVEFSEAKSSELPEGESSMLAFEDYAIPDKGEDTICPSNTTMASNPSLNLKDSAQNTTGEVKSMNEPSQPGLPTCKRLHVELDYSIPQVNLQTTSLSSKDEPYIVKPSCDSISFDVLSEQSPWPVTKQPKHPACEIKPEIAVEPVAAVRSQHEQQEIIKESKNNGSTLWPGFFPKGSHGAEVQGLSLQSSAAKIPAWLDNAACAVQPGSDSRLQQVDRRNKIWKRCSVHVHISRLIKVLQDAEKKDRSSIQPTQVAANEGSKQGVLTLTENLNELRNGSNGISSANSLVASATRKNPAEVANSILLHQRLLQDQQQTSTSSGFYTLQKQSFDCSSSSAVAGGAEANTSTNKAEGGLKQLTQSHVPYLQSHAQSHMPFSMPQNRYSSTPFPDHLPAAAAQKIQLPPYLGGPFWDPVHRGTIASPKQQQQQQIWATQLAAQCNPGGIVPSHIPNWQNERIDYALVPYAQPLLTSSRTSLEVIGPKHAPISQHQQQLITLTSSLLPAIMKRQHHDAPSGYEGNGGGFHPSTSPSLQLLCNEHL